MRKQKSTDAALGQLREFGLRYPGAHLKSPWPGHLDLAVKDKTFAFLSAPGEPFSISCKLPHSNALALELPFTEPTAYALGRSGWVSARIPASEPLPLEIFKAWIDESYRAQAPKKLVAALAETPASAETKRAAAKKRRAVPAKKRRAPGSKKPAAKKRS